MKKHCMFCDVLCESVNDLELHLENHHGDEHVMKQNRDQQQEKLKQQHENKSAVKVEKFCGDCDKIVNNIRSHVRSEEHRSTVRKNLDSDIKIVKSAFNKNILSYEIQNNKDILYPIDFLNASKELIIKTLKNELNGKTLIKFNMELQGLYVKPNNEKDGPSTSKELTIENIFNHISKTTLLTLGDDLEEVVFNHCVEIIAKSEEFQERGSNWALEKLLKLDINVLRANLTRGSHYIPTPKSLSNKKGACLNIKNYDDFCFKWCMVVALGETAYGDPSITSSYNVDIHQDVIILQSGISLNFEQLNFPLGLKYIKKFEMNNPEISVNVFGYENKSVVGPYYLTKETKSNHINLILLHNEENFHYILVMDMSCLMRSQFTSHKEKGYFCFGCLQCFHDENKCMTHKKQCGKVVCALPNKKEAVLKFVNHKKKDKVPFVIYADSESVLEDVQEDENNGASKKTEKVKKHIPCAFSYFIKCSFNENLNKLFIYSGPDAANVFLKELIQDCKFLYDSYLTKTKPMNTLTPEEETAFLRDINCRICGDILGNDRVKDHCHLTGQYRGAVHNHCNLQYHLPKFIPIYFHNFSSYDCHLFFKELVEFGGEIRVIPQNKEKYISMSYFINMDNESTDSSSLKSTVVVGEEEDSSEEDDEEFQQEEESEGKKEKKKKMNRLEHRFLDSFRFMPTSLDKLARNLSRDSFVAVRSHFPDDESFELMTRKGVFPYEYMSSFEKLKEKQLPPIDQFYNKLTDTECSSDDYRHATNVWSHFRCQTMQDYMDLYLKADVLLLADVFENFRSLCMRIHELDPCQYLTAPSLSWDAMLLCTKVELELLRDIDMYNFCKNGIRGGLTQCSNRHSVANNEDAPNYNSAKPEVNIYYLDVNNLYGTVMTECLPEKDFRWVEGYEMEKFNDPAVILSIPDNAPTGFILEVDIEYPPHLHDKHNDLPFLAEKKCVEGSKTEKLIADFTDKTSYTIHYKLLKQSLKHGLILKKVHRVLAFTQSAWLAPYILKNNEHREKAENAFEKDFFKLLNNSSFGKTMENIDKRKTVKIVTMWVDEANQRRRNVASKLISKPNFHSLSIFSENMVAIQIRNVRVKYDRPLYLGFCILDLSKWRPAKKYKMIVYNTKRFIRKKHVQGGGLVNKLINSLPVELHLPGYQFCGPGTKLEKRIQRGDQGINPLDAACRAHDIAYSQNKDIEQRHIADRELTERAWERAEKVVVVPGDCSFQRRHYKLILA
ncbi:uncharacterized protein LOC131806273 [Musca domestica]|uniref:DNA-directed DNA polymerase n=1 Tax=Musca domestica TaxID=7370 RepID=A0ABM3VKA9_MUSDO|nr:uncharacterized protein LOC131806273 [Musca domestica]